MPTRLEHISERRFYGCMRPVNKAMQRQHARNDIRTGIVAFVERIKLMPVSRVNNINVFEQLGTNDTLDRGAVVFSALVDKIWVWHTNMEASARPPEGSFCFKKFLFKVYAKNP